MERRRRLSTMVMTLLAATLGCIQNDVLAGQILFYWSKLLDPFAPPRHLLGSHTVLGISVPGGVNFVLFMAYSFSYKYS